MSLIGVQRRMRELGRIRLGEKGVAKNGKSFPKKLTGFRLTSMSHPLLLVAADLYGGEVRKWEGAPGQGDQWELYMGDRIDVLLPPGEPLTQSFEMWSGGGCVRRCNGMTMADGTGCQCPADLNDRIELARTGGACKPTTRLGVILPRIPDIGVWRMETHGYNAAVELPGTVDILKALSAGGGMIPAFLRIEQRTSVKDGETRHFVVPVLELPTVTVAELQAGQQAPALEAPAAAPALPSGPSRPTPPPAGVLAPVPPPPPSRPSPAVQAVPPAQEEAQHPMSPPPLPADLANPNVISGLIERLNALTGPDRAKFKVAFGNPRELPAGRAVEAEVFVTELEDDPFRTPAQAADDPGRPFEAGPPEVSGEDELAQVREKSTSPGQAHAPTDDASTHPHLAPSNQAPRASIKDAQRLHIDAKALGISEEDLDFLILNETAGISSSAKDLTLSQIGTVVDRMQKISERPDGAAQMAEIRNRVLEAAGQQAMVAP